MKYIKDVYAESKVKLSFPLKESKAYSDEVNHYKEKYKFKHSL